MGAGALSIMKLSQMPSVAEKKRYRDCSSDSIAEKRPRDEESDGAGGYEHGDGQDDADRLKRATTVSDKTESRP